MISLEQNMKDIETNFQECLKLCPYKIRSEFTLKKNPHPADIDFWDVRQKIKNGKYLLKYKSKFSDQEEDIGFITKVEGKIIYEIFSPSFIENVLSKTNKNMIYLNGVCSNNSFKIDFVYISMDITPKETYYFLWPSSLSYDDD